MTELTILEEAMRWDQSERFISETEETKHIVDKMELMELVMQYDGVLWVTYEGEAYARGEMC